MDSLGFWSTSNLPLGWRSPYIGSRAGILPQIARVPAVTTIPDIDRVTAEASARGQKLTHGQFEFSFQRLLFVARSHEEPTASSMPAQ